jgi:hypothetical protein
MWNYIQPEDPSVESHIVLKTKIRLLFGRPLDNGIDVRYF